MAYVPDSQWEGSNDALKRDVWAELQSKDATIATLREQLADYRRVHTLAVQAVHELSDLNRKLQDEVALYRQLGLFPASCVCNK